MRFNKALPAGVRARLLLGLLLMPSLTVFFAIRVRQAEGPPWLSSNLENNYAYLFNSLNVANLHRPYFVTHPGTPVQAFGGVALRAMNMTADRTQLAREVLSKPEHYILAIDNLLILLCGLSLLLAGYAALFVFRQFVPALLIQAAPLLSNTTLKYLTFVGPEVLITSLSILVVAATLLLVKEPRRSYELRYSGLLGLIVGIGIASKFTLAPVAIFVLVVLISWKARAVFAAACATAFVMSVSLVLPLWGSMFASIFNLATHTGRYGRGASGFVDSGLFVSSAMGIVRNDPFYFVIMIGGAVLLLWNLRFLKRNETNYRLLLAVTVAQLVQFFLVAKHPPNYNLIPSLALSGLNLAIIFHIISGKLPLRMGSMLALVFVVVIGAVQFWSINNLFKSVRADAEVQIAAYETSNATYRNVPMVTYYTASSPYYSLFYGSVYVSNFYGGVLQELYPNQFFYNPWDQKFSDFAGPVEPDQIQGRSQSFILRGCSFSDSRIAAFLPEKPLPDRIELKQLPNPGLSEQLMCREGIYQAKVSLAK